MSNSRKKLVALVLGTHVSGIQPPSRKPDSSPSKRLSDLERPTFCLHARPPANCPCVAAPFQKLLKSFVHKNSFRNTRRCTTWAMLDSMSMYMRATYVVHWKGAPAMLLATLVICTVCVNSWRAIQSVFGADGVPNGLTALGYHRMWKRALEQNPGLTIAQDPLVSSAS